MVKKHKTKFRSSNLLGWLKVIPMEELSEDCSKHFSFHRPLHMHEQSFTHTHTHLKDTYAQTLKQAYKEHHWNTLELAVTR